MMLLPIPIPVALVCPAYLIDDDADLKDTSLTSLHKETLAALKKAGYKRTRVEEDDLVLVGTSTEVDILSPDGKEKISLKLYTEDDSTVERETVVPESKADAYARYRPLLKEKFPNVQLTCYEYGNKTYAGVQMELSEANPKRVMDAIEETKKAIALIEANRGATSTPAPMPSDPIAATMKQAGLIFKDIGIFYSLRYDFSDTKRSQAAYIRKRVDSYNSLKIHEVYSIFYDAKDAPSAELLQRIFQKRFSIGGLVLEAPSESQSNWRIRFRIDAPENVAPDRLKKYVNLVAGTADSLEKEFFLEDKVH